MSSLSESFRFDIICLKKMRSSYSSIVQTQIGFYLVNCFIRPILIFCEMYCIGCSILSTWCPQRNLRPMICLKSSWCFLGRRVVLLSVLVLLHLNVTRLITFRDGRVVWSFTCIRFQSCREQLRFSVVLMTLSLTQSRGSRSLPWLSWNKL